MSATMSRYLVDRISGLANVEVLTQTEISGLEGKDSMLEAIRWKDASCRETTHAVRHLFMFSRVDPNTDWLSGADVTLDQKGFVVTGKGNAGPLRDECARAVRRGRYPFRVGQARRGLRRRRRAGRGSATHLPR